MTSTKYDYWVKRALIDAQEKLPGWKIKEIGEDGTVWYGSGFIHTPKGFVTPFEEF